MDIQWQNVQSLFQIIVTFDIAIPIFCGFAQSTADSAQRFSSDVRGKLHVANLDITLIEKLERIEKWRGPNVSGELRAIYQPIERKYFEIDNKIDDLDEKMGKESTFYILMAIAHGIIFTASIFYATIHPFQNLRLSTVWAWSLTGLSLPLVSLLRTAGKQARFSELSRGINQQVLKMLDFTLDIQRSSTGEFNNRPDIQLKQYKDGDGAAIWAVIDPSKPRSGF